MNTLYSFTILWAWAPFFAQSQELSLWERIAERYGFPIVVCVALGLFIYYQTKTENARREKQSGEEWEYRKRRDAEVDAMHREQIQSNKEVVNRATQVAVLVADLILLSEFAQHSMKERAKSVAEESKRTGG